MKLRSFFLIGITSATLVFASCRKDRVCKCTTTYSDGSYSTENYTMNGDNIVLVPGSGTSKKSQEANCNAKEQSSSSSTTSCGLVK